MAMDRGFTKGSYATDCSSSLALAWAMARAHCVIHGFFFLCYGEIDDDNGVCMTRRKDL
jgi:hypothetical protein